MKKVNWILFGILFLFLGIIVINRAVIRYNQSSLLLGDIKTYPVGDVNGDCNVSSLDIVLVKKHMLKLSTLTGEKFIRADVKRDNLVNAADYVLIKKTIINGGVKNGCTSDNLTYTVTYQDLNKKETKKEGEALGSLPTTSKSGYKFLGWFTDSTGGTQVSASTKVTGNMTLYAHWEKISNYEITYYDLNKKETKKEGEALGSLPTTSKSGYKFLGWFTDSTGGTQVSASTKVTGNMTLYAHWEKIATADKLEIHFIASGYYDDAIYIKTSQASIFIDGGRGKDLVVKYLKKLNVNTIDYVIGSHTEYDHIDAQGEVIKQFNVKHAIYPNDITSCGCRCTSEDVGSVNNALKSKNMKPEVQSIPSKLQVGNMTLYFLAPLSFGCNKNNNSFVFILQFGNNKFMFTGDAETALYKQNISKLNANAQSLGLSDIKVDVFKYPHHGQQGLDDAFMDAIGAKKYVIPNYNAAHYPTQYYMNNTLKPKGITWYRQSDSKTGNILITSDGNNITFKMDA